MGKQRCKILADHSLDKPFITSVGCQERAGESTPCMHYFEPFPRALTPAMLGRGSRTQQLHGVIQCSLAYIPMFILEPNCLSDLRYPKGDLELVAAKFFKEGPAHGTRKKTRKNGTTGTFLHPHPSWGWLEVAPSMPVEPNAVCVSEAATISPSARDMLSGKVGGRGAEHSTPTSSRQARFERRGSVLSVPDILLGGGRLPVSFSSEEVTWQSIQTAAPGERFQDVARSH